MLADIFFEVILVKGGKVVRTRRILELFSIALFSKL